jgi:hypothetical protein
LESGKKVPKEWLPAFVITDKFQEGKPMKQLMLILGVTILLCSYGLAKEVTATNSLEPLSLSDQQKPTDVTTGIRAAPQDFSSENQEAAVQPEKQEKDDPINNWVTLTLLFIPALAGLVIALINECRDCWKGYDVVAGPSTPTKTRLRFPSALINGFIWVVIFVVLASLKVYSFNFFNNELNFELYVPVLGFLGALLFVLDLSRRGRQDIPVGTEFGMRIVMGPYVAIVVVMLFGQNFKHINLSSPIGKATLAFSSGLVVVAALQRLIEASQEKLGEWRKRTRYEPSEIAREFHLSQEEDRVLSKADLHYLIQLEKYPEDELKEKARKAGFDAYLAAGLKHEYDKRLLYKAIGDSVWDTMKKEVEVNKNLEEFAHLTDQALEKVTKANPHISLSDLKKLRDKARILFGLGNTDEFHGKNDSGYTGDLKKPSDSVVLRFMSGLRSLLAA